MKAILVDAIGTLVTRNKGVDEAVRRLLEEYPNRKIVLTNADDGQIKTLGLTDAPYELFTLKRNPDKTDPEYFRKMLAHFDLTEGDVVYLEHSEDAAQSAQSVGIKTYRYDSGKRDLEQLKKFLDENL